MSRHTECFSFLSEADNSNFVLVSSCNVRDKLSELCAFVVVGWYKQSHIDNRMNKKNANAAFALVAFYAIVTALVAIAVAILVAVLQQQPARTIAWQSLLGLLEVLLCTVQVSAEIVFYALFSQPTNSSR